MTDPYRQPYNQQPLPPVWQPRAPRRRQRGSGLMITLLTVLSVLLISVGLTAAYTLSQNDKPAAPANVTTTEATRPAVDVGAGTPGAACATNRLGKTFTGADGIVYTCGGPKPYHWLPPS